MTTYNQRFVLIQCPKTTDESNRLSVQTTQDYGLDGWQIVSTEYIQNPDGTPQLLLVFQK